MGPEVGACIRGALLCPQCRQPTHREREAGPQNSWCPVVTPHTFMGCQGHVARQQQSVSPPPCPSPCCLSRCPPSPALQSRTLTSESVPGAGNRTPGASESPGARVSSRDRRSLWEHTAWRLCVGKSGSVWHTGTVTWACRNRHCSKGWRV